jgi:hypothetical protein
MAGQWLEVNPLTYAAALRWSQQKPVTKKPPYYYWPTLFGNFRIKRNGTNETRPASDHHRSSDY